MNRLFYFLLVALGSGLTLYFEWPWFMVAFFGLIAATLLRMRRRAGFKFAFLATLFTWGGYLSYLSLTNDGILAERMAGLFQLPGGWWIVIITALWGGITAGLGGWTGINLQKALNLWEKGVKR